MTNPHETKKSISTIHLLSDFRLLLYNFTIILFSPYFLLTKFRRRYSKKKLTEFLLERWTIPVEQGEPFNSKTPHVVFIAMGFGEKHTAEQVAEALKALRPDIQITLAVKAKSTFESIRKLTPNQSVTYIPFDFLLPAARWFRKLKPDVVVSVQKFWIPNVLWISKRGGAAVCVISGQDERYVKSNLNIWTYINRWTLKAFDTIGLLNENEIQKFHHLFSEHADVRVTGIAKLPQSPQKRTAFKELRLWIESHNKKGLPVIAAGSIHQIEDEFILEAFEKVRATTPCTLLYAPRHIREIEKKLTLFAKHHLIVSRRSHFGNDHQETNADILLLDTMGELSVAYSYADAAYVGGTLNAPGHNVLEPVEWGVPVFFGPGDGSIPMAQMLALNAGAGFRVHSSSELAEYWIHILKEPEYRQKLKKCCGSIIAEQKQALGNNLKIITELVDSVITRG